MYDDEESCTGTHECGCQECDRYWKMQADMDGEPVEPYA